MGLFGRSRTTAGLDIGSGFVKLVVIEHGKSGPEAARIAVRPLVPDAIVEGEIMDPAVVADTVRAVVDEAGAKKARLVAAVGGHDVIIKRIHTDRMVEARARELIRWEAQQHVPFEMENVELDFQILDPARDAPEMAVLIVAAKKELIENRINLLADAGLEADVIDVDAFALHNAFERSYPSSVDGYVALINVGNETTNVNLLEDGVPVLVRDIPFGVRRLREALQRERGMTAERADATIRGKGEGTAELREFLTERAEELALGLERATALIAAQSGGNGVGRAWVSGGDARVPGLVDALGTRLGIRTELANPFEQVRVRPEVMEFVAIDEIAPMLMLPVGLALRTPR